MPNYKGEENAAEATAFPVPGKYYTIQKSDSAKGLSGISAKAYGDGKQWRKIWKANKHIARSDDPNNSFWPGDTIWIPGEAPVEEEIIEDIVEELPGADPDQITIIVDGQEIVPSSASITLWFNSAADGWAATVPWDPEDETQRRIYRPYGYQPAECYLGGKLKVRGVLYIVEPSFSPSGRQKRLEGWAFTADVIDSSMRPPYEKNKINLENRAKELCEPLGVSVVWRAGEDKPFDRVSATKDSTILAHLADLAKQRGVQISSTPQGKLLFHKAEDSLPVSSFIEGEPPLTEGTVSYNGRERFGSYTARTQSPKKNAQTATSEDKLIPAQRQTSFTVEDSDKDDLQKAADWRRSKQLAESMRMEVPVNSWYDSFGDLWEVGALVTLISPSLDLRNGFDFLIEKVEFVMEENGNTATLTLVPPQIYTGDPLPEPWGEEPDYSTFGDEAI
jgi:prophage tail gpP-like protein